MRCGLALVSLFCSAMGSENYSILKKSWELIGLQGAYKDHPTIRGQGITIGIIDGQFNPDHPSLKGKAKGLFNNDYDFVNSYEGKSTIGNVQHGTHVAGIILGADRDAYGEPKPHGIAYEASFYGVGLLHSRNTYQGDLFEDLADKNLKIINNSWEIFGFFPLINRSFDQGYRPIRVSDLGLDPIGADDYFRLLSMPSHGSGASLVRLSRERGILNIVGSANSGSITSSFLGAAAAYDESLRSWLVVGAVDAHNIVNEAGKIKVVTGVKTDYYYSGIAYFSNLFRGVALYGLMAPGMYIDSANAMYGNTNPYMKEEDKREFATMSGTSQATPMVSGAAVLVQQKYGFLNGAQIADVLLSTASYENVELPKMIVQMYGNGGFYNVIYIDKDPPKDQQGKINIEGVKQDLIALGYTQKKAEEILKTLYKTQTAVDQGLNSDAEGILRLEKHEVIGQGILNVQKALKGLARLDANRLNLQDITSFEGEDQAFYTIDTQGMSGEFGNDITQRTWEDKWHLLDARNSPVEKMRNITKVGIIKKGSGTLALSGNNDYQGATRVWDGELEIKSGSTLRLSNVYVEQNTATLSLLGHITKNLSVQDGGSALLHTGSGVGGSGMADRGGAIRVLGSSSVGGSVMAQRGGRIELGDAFGVVSLGAGSVHLSSGGLVLGAGTITTTGAEIAVVRMANGVENGFYNESGIVKAGFGRHASKTFDPSIHKLSIQGTYRHGKDATLQIAFSGAHQNSQIIATQYEIQGGTLDFIPTYDWRSTLMRPNQKIPLVFDVGFQAQTQKFDRIQTQSNNLLDFIYFHEDPALGSLLRPQALRPTDQEDREVGEVLRDIYSYAALSPKYEDYFKAISDIPHSAYQASVDSIAPNISLLIAQDTLRTTSQAMLRHAMSALDFYASSVFWTQMPKNEIFVDGIYAFSAHSDAMGMSLQYQYAGTRGAFRVFGDYLKGGGKYDFATTDSHRFLGGISGVYEVSPVTFLISASGGMGLNHSYRSVLDGKGGSELAVGKNKSYVFSTQAGLHKDFLLTSFVLRPMVLIDYAGVFQEDYRERGELFAKAYEGGINHRLSALLGGSVGYKMDFGAMSFLVGVFGFYGIGILGTLSEEAHFIDFPAGADPRSARGNMVRQLYLNAHSFQGGLNLEFSYGSFFVRTGIGTEVGARDWWLSSTLTLGGRF